MYYGIKEDIKEGIKDTQTNTIEIPERNTRICCQQLFDK